MSNPFSDRPTPPQQNPYAPPSEPDESFQQPFDARSKLLPPAICLLIFGSLDLVYRIFNAIVVLMRVDQFDTPQAAGMIVGGVVPLVFSICILYGAVCMLRLIDYRTAYVSSWLACLPLCGTCFILGIPFGIWSLVVLNDPRVKAQFN